MAHAGLGNGLVELLEIGLVCVGPQQLWSLQHLTSSGAARLELLPIAIIENLVREPASTLLSRNRPLVAFRWGMFVLSASDQLLMCSQKPCS